MADLWGLLWPFLNAAIRVAFLDVDDFLRQIHGTLTGTARGQAMTVNPTKINRIQIGTLYKVILGDGTFAVMQFVGTDGSQLWSDMVRVFAETFPVDTRPEDVIATNFTAKFEAHTSLAAGAKLKLWSRLGVAPIDRQQRTLYRVSDDSGDPSVRRSVRWRVWSPNEEKRFVGALNDETRKAEIGTVTNPHSLLHRIKTGERTHFYPDG